MDAFSSQKSIDCVMLAKQQKNNQEGMNKDMFVCVSHANAFHTHTHMFVYVERDPLPDLVSFVSPLLAPLLGMHTSCLGGEDGSLKAGDRHIPDSKDL